MKKYLMSGIAAIAFAAAFTSCSKSTDLYEEGRKEKDEAEQKIVTAQESYATAFVQTFTTPAQGHRWGFGTTTRAHDVNGNLWYQNWERPVNVTDAEKDVNGKVIQEFSKKRENVVNSIDIDWENYWVQQVYQSSNSYPDGNGNQTGDIHTKMNKIIAYNGNSKTEEIYWPEHTFVTYDGYYEHVNNFNDGTNVTTYTDDITKEVFYGTTLMKDMGVTPQGTPKFGYNNTVDSKDHFEYIILEIEGAYYVGFDFCASHPEGQEANKNMDVERDWIYNDWIVKISPAYPKAKENGRVFCEDLGTIGDFDFNDVVFDARIFNDGSIDITVLAAGGTLPISVAGTPITIGQMTNTGVNAGGTQKIHIDPVNGQPKYASIIDIPIVVSGDNNATYALNAPIGEAPQKICVPIGTPWVDEYENINKAFPKFTQWVGNEGITFWEEPVAKYTDHDLSNNN